MSAETGDLENFFASYPADSYEPGERVVRPWELVNGSIVWVRSGVLRVSAPARGGREVTVCHIVAGRYKTIVFGLAPYMRRHTVEAITRVEAYRAPRTAFLEYAARHPGVYRLLAEGRMRHISDLYDQLWAAKLGDATQRVATTLLYLCMQSGRAEMAERVGEPEAEAYDTADGDGGDRMTLTYPLTQRALADLTSLSRETVSTAMATLRRKGLVTHKGRVLRIESMAALRAEVERSV